MLNLILCSKYKIGDWGVTVGVFNQQFNCKKATYAMINASHVIWFDNIKLTDLTIKTSYKITQKTAHRPDLTIFMCSNRAHVPYHRLNGFY